MKPCTASKKPYPRALESRFLLSVNGLRSVTVPSELGKLISDAYRTLGSVSQSAGRPLRSAGCPRSASLSSFTVPQAGKPQGVRSEPIHGPLPNAVALPRFASMKYIRIT